ncbi:MAG: sirohydrochlorin chelatase [Elusimicrobia bacterium]|nr:sirohydrochlorin chelatase [Elusimicrobiota bacterium]
MTDPNQAILILGHGSRDPLAVQEFLDFTQEFKSRNGFCAQATEMATAFLELSSPSIPQALEYLDGKGARNILAVPYFLFRAGHVKREIPEMLETFSETHPHVSIAYGESLWPHPNLITLAKQRIENALRKISDVPNHEVDILIVGRGATDPEALSQFREAVETLRRALTHRTLRHCFVALSEPKYSEVLPEMLSSGARNLILFPFYLFTGILVKRIENMARESEKNFKDARIHVVPHLGQDPLMFATLQDRIRELINARG